VTKGRLEAFSDGVFAIAITLLALNLPTPDGAGPLGHFVTAHWTSYAAYLDSFFIIGIIWLNHHALFNISSRTSRQVNLVNLVLLLFVVTIPYVTGLLATYLRTDEGGAHLAAAIYSGVMLGMAVTMTALFELLSRLARVDDPTRVDRNVVRARRRRFGAGQLVYAGTVGLAFVSAPATLVVHFVISGYYLFDQLPSVERDPTDQSRPA
jgi:uncharacterized membrane protein